jgi:hypothetical protein
MGHNRIQPAATKTAPVAAIPARTPSVGSVSTPTPTPITAPTTIDPISRPTADRRIAAFMGHNSKPRRSGGIGPLVRNQSAISHADLDRRKRLQREDVHL